MIELLPYQEIGRDFLMNNRHCLLADEMGLGKTPQAIRAASDLDRIMVICPAVAKHNWKAEFKKFDDRDAQIVEGGFPIKKEIAIMSFHHAAKHLNQYTHLPWDAVIIDEWHYLKEPKARRTQAILGSDGIIHNADRVWALTGTPAPNHAGELWTLLYNFGLTKLSYQGFIDRYCNVYQVGNHYGRVQISGTNVKHSHELKSLLSKCSLRRKKKNVLDLPPIFHNQYPIEADTKNILGVEKLKALLKEELRIIQEEIGFTLNDVSDEKLIPTLEILSQSMPALRRYHGIKKINPVAGLIIDELKAGLYKKIVIFGIHKLVLHNLKELFEANSITTVLVDGATAPYDRFKAQNDFQLDDKVQVFIGNIQAAGTNLTLTAANQVGFIEQDWVPGNNAQAADRCHRWGQDESVTVRHFSIIDSIDEKITRAVTKKIQEIATFIS